MWRRLGSGKVDTDLKMMDSDGSARSLAAIAQGKFAQHDADAHRLDLGQRVLAGALAKMCMALVISTCWFWLITASIVPSIRKPRVSGVISWPMKTTLCWRPASLSARDAVGAAADVVDANEVRVLAQQYARLLVVALRVVESLAQSDQA